MPILRMHQITKIFPGVVANDHIDLSVEKGEIHGVLGENGAGKTTLMNILGGIYTADSGKVYLRNKEVKFKSPKDAIANGIGMVHQHFMLVPPLSVAENIYIGLQRNTSFFNIKKINKEIAEICQKFGLKVSPEAKIWQLSAGERQRVEILKVLYRKADILILDEPTSVLTPQETKELFTSLRSLTKEGHTVLFISHKLNEVLEITDRITILRNGKVTATLETKDATKEKLARLMIGRDVLFSVTKPPSKVGGVILELNGVHALKDNGLPALKNVTFSIRAGEILGVAGIAGNGQKELAEVITGLRKTTAGRIRLLNKDITNNTTEEILKQGVGHIPDEKMDGLVANLSVRDNTILETHEQFCKNLIFDFTAVNKYATGLISTFDVKCPDCYTLTANLSGGNLQKLILGREISRNPNLLVASNPTRGLDVGATEYIRNKLIEQKTNGKAILLISEDLDEILDLSDRMAIIYEGEIMGIIRPEEAKIDEVSMMMTGTKRKSG